ncbi:MAG TPA: DUF192 domain-containing protein [Methanocella sp.]|nr:DUF192 domain-containing protein [Methanocella sp.]
MVLMKTDGTVVATSVELASTLIKQTIGLMFRSSIPEHYAMIFDMRREQYIGIHMLFVRFPIDLVYLDKDRRITDIKRLRSWTGVAFPSRPARYAIEMRVGASERSGLKVGDVLSW